MQMLRGMFGILMTLLNANAPVTRKTLAEKFEMSERTVSRYIDAMSADMGIPVAVAFGTGGGYYLADNFRINRSFFTAEEYDLVLTALAAVENELESAKIKAVKEKFESLRFDEESDRYIMKNDRLVIDSTSWSDADGYRNTISALNKAMDASVTVRLDYADKAGMRSARDFDPYTLVLKEGVWYVYGWCHARKDFRLFKLSRIKALYISGDTFLRREGGDVYAKLNEQFIDRQKAFITVRFDAEVLAEVEEWLGMDSVRGDGDAFIASAQVYSEDLLIKKLLSFCQHMEVLSPHYFAEEKKVALKRSLSLYEKSPSPESV